MEAKGVFDLITHIFLAFPLVIIWKFTQPFKEVDGKFKLNTDFGLLLITCLVLIASVLHHCFSHIRWLEAMDEGFVGLSIIYVFYIYVDGVLNKQTKANSASTGNCQNCQEYKWYIILGIILVAYGVCVGIDMTNDINKNSKSYATVICTAVVVLGAVGIFFGNLKDIKEKHDSGDYKYLKVSVLFAVLAAVMFLINDMAEQFHLHSLWHVFAFISFGYLIIFVVSPNFKTAADKVDNATSRATQFANSVKAIQYAVSLSVRLLLIGYYGYVASLEEIPPGWMYFAFAWGGVSFICGLYFGKAERWWLGIRLVSHGFLWILVGAFLLSVREPVAVIACLVFDFLFSIRYMREKIKDHRTNFNANINPIELANVDPGYTGYRYAVLRF